MNRFLCALLPGLLALPTVSVHAENSDAWPALRDVSLAIERGSVLDFSALHPGKAIGPDDRLIVSAQGRLARRASPDKPERFLIAALGFASANGGLPDKAQIDAYVQQLVLRGYNMARLDFVEDLLVAGRGSDFDFNPLALDRLHYLVAALRREGVYITFNILSSPNGAKGGITNRWENQFHIKEKLYFDRVARWHWQHLVDQLFARTNPYTGDSLLKDPAVGGLILVNESGLEFLYRAGATPELNAQFALWLEKRYGELEVWRKAWRGELGEAEGSDWRNARLPRPDAGNSVRMADAQRFFADLQRGTFGWMKAYLAERGYDGPVTALNNWLSPAAQAARAQFSWVDMHNYQGEPSRFVQPGSFLKQESLLAQAGKYVTELASARHLGHAYTVTEFGQVFWSKYRRESALLVPAMAAFQEWDGICQHSYAVELQYGQAGGRKEAMYPFVTALDPVARVTETMAALLYRRGDVLPARSRVAIRFSPRHAYEQAPYLSALPSDISRLSLLTGVGLVWRSNDTELREAVSPALKSQLSFEPDIPTLFSGPGLLGGSVRKFSAERMLPERVDALRSAGILPAGNRTDVGAGRYESDTGQMTLDARAETLRLKTAATEAVLLPAQAGPFQAGLLNVVDNSEAALIALAAVDGQALPESRRMLLVLATDARNTGMRFQDAREERLEALGRLPVRIKPLRVSLRIGLPKGDYELWSVAQSGKRLERLPLVTAGNDLLVTIDTGLLERGPATYFELLRR